MALTGTKLKQIKARLIAGKVIDLLEKHDMLNKRIDVGLREWDGKKVMVSKITGIEIEEQEELEQEIIEQVNTVL